MTTTPFKVPAVETLIVPDNDLSGAFVDPKGFIWDATYGYRNLFTDAGGTLWARNTHDLVNTNESVVVQIKFPGTVSKILEVRGLVSNSHLSGLHRQMLVPIDTSSTGIGSPLGVNLTMGSIDAHVTNSFELTSYNQGVGTLSTPGSLNNAFAYTLPESIQANYTQVWLRCQGFNNANLQSLSGIKGIEVDYIS